MVQPPIGVRTDREEIWRSLDLDPRQFDHIQQVNRGPPALASVCELVFYLTSERVLDRISLSDFFFTYRSYAQPQIVLQLLWSRMAAALEMDRPYGVEPRPHSLGVAVRVFVALRYWILNFFADDFLPNDGLRAFMAAALSFFVDAPQVRDSRALDLLFRQLVRAWHNEISYYWPSQQMAASTVREISFGGVYTPAMFPRSPVDSLGMSVLDIYEHMLTPCSPFIHYNKNKNPVLGGIGLNTDFRVQQIMKPASPNQHHCVQDPNMHLHDELASVKIGNYADLLQLCNLEELNRLLLESKYDKNLNRNAHLQPVRPKLSMSAAECSARPFDFVLTPNTPPVDSQDLLVPSIYASTKQPTGLGLLNHPVDCTWPAADGTLPTSSASKLSNISGVSASSPWKKNNESKDTFQLENMKLMNTSNDTEAVAEVASLEDPINLRRSALDCDVDGALARLDIQNATYEGSLDSNSIHSQSRTLSVPRTRIASTRSEAQRGHHLDNMEPRTRPDEIDYDNNDNTFGSRENSVVRRTDTSSISLLSEYDNGAMAPCEGFTSHVAAELAAIPDESFGEDPVETTRRKLLGLYQPRYKKKQQMRDSLLYNVALGGNVDLHQLPDADCLPTTPQHIRFSDEVENLLIPSPSYTQNSGRERYLAGPAYPRTPRTPTSETHRKFGESGIVSPMLFSHGHAPFILSYSPQELAEHFTLIEKSTVELVEWRKLVDLQWVGIQPVTTSWLAYLLNGPKNSIDLVSARFNLVVNWVSSEIALCPTTELMSETISRYIHTANCSYLLNNFATTVQIVVALTTAPRSQSVAAAWRLISKKDMDILGRLKEVTSPENNWQALRAAHAQVEFSKGCIPFLGLYLSDLMHLNSDAGVVDNEINFSKCASVASTVRLVLQYINWSNNYNLRPCVHLLSKCLYLRTLDSGELSRL